MKAAASAARTTAAAIPIAMGTAAMLMLSVEAAGSQALQRRGQISVTFTNPNIVPHLVVMVTHAELSVSGQVGSAGSSLSALLATLTFPLLPVVSPPPPLFSPLFLLTTCVAVVEVGVVIAVVAVVAVASDVGVPMAAVEPVFSPSFLLATGVAVVEVGVDVDVVVLVAVANDVGVPLAAVKMVPSAHLVDWLPSNEGPAKVEPVDAGADGAIIRLLPA